MNCWNHNSNVAREKILMQHFADVNKSVDIFGPMEVRVIPTALSWIGRDRLGYALMFHYLHSMPWLLESSARLSSD